MIFVFIAFVCVAIFGVFIIIFLVDTIRNGLAPSIPTPNSAIGEIIRGLRIAKGDEVVELGCGDARIIKRAASNHPEANFIGIDNGIVALIRAKVNTIGAKNISIKYGDIKNISNLNANKYLCYLSPEALEIIKKKLPKGCTLVSVEYKFKKIKPFKSIALREPTNLVHKIHMYVF